MLDWTISNAGANWIGVCNFDTTDIAKYINVTASSLIVTQFVNPVANLADSLISSAGSASAATVTMGSGATACTTVSSNSYHYIAGSVISMMVTGSLFF